MANYTGHTGTELPLADFDTALRFLRTHGEGSGVMRCLRDCSDPTKRWHCLCEDSTSMSSAVYRIDRSTFKSLRSVLTSNTYCGYNRWFIYDYKPDVDKEQADE